MSRLDNDKAVLLWTLSIYSKHTRVKYSVLQMQLHSVGWRLLWVQGGAAHAHGRSVVPPRGCGSINHLVSVGDILSVPALWLPSILWPSLPCVGGWLWQPAHQSECVVETDEGEQNHCSSHAGVQSCVLQLLVRHDFTGTSHIFFRPLTLPPLSPAHPFGPGFNFVYGVAATVRVWYKYSALTNVVTPVTARWQRKAPAVSDQKLH